jgi:hypothetical protein
MEINILLLLWLSEHYTKAIWTTFNSVLQEYSFNIYVIYIGYTFGTYLLCQKQTVLFIGRGEGRKLRYDMTNFVWNRPFWCRVFITLQSPFSNEIVIRIKIDLFTIFPQRLFVSEWMIVCLKKSSKKATNAKFSHGVVTYFYLSEHIANKIAARSTTRGFLFKWKHTFKQARVNVYFRYFFIRYSWLFFVVFCSWK